MTRTNPMLDGAHSRERKFGLHLGAFAGLFLGMMILAGILFLKLPQTLWLLRKPITVLFHALYYEAPPPSLARYDLAGNTGAEESPLQRLVNDVSNEADCQGAVAA